MIRLTIIIALLLLTGCGGAGTQPDATDSGEKRDALVQLDAGESRELTLFGETKTVDQVRSEETARIEEFGAAQVCGPGLDFLLELIGPNPSDDETTFLEIMAELCEEYP